MKPIPTIAAGLTIAFVVLKVIDKTDLSWWWVWSPLWIWFSIIAFLKLLHSGLNHFCWKYGDKETRIRLLKQGYNPFK